MDLIVQSLMESLGVFYYILVYGVGILAMVLSMIAFQFKHRVTIILCTLFGQSCWVLYFLLQGDVTSAISCGLTAAMLFVFSKSEQWKWATHPISLIFFFALLSGSSLLSFKNWTDIFPILGGGFNVIANSRKSEKRLRQFAALSCVSWLSNSILKMYPVALISDALCTVSTIVGLIRYREKK